jgi:hypothetical protein
MIATQLNPTILSFSASTAFPAPSHLPRQPSTRSLPGRASLPLPALPTHSSLPPIHRSHSNKASTQFHLGTYASTPHHLLAFFFTLRRVCIISPLACEALFAAFLHSDIYPTRRRFLACRAFSINSCSRPTNPDREQQSPYCWEIYCALRPSSVQTGFLNPGCDEKTIMTSHPPCSMRPPT